MDDSFLLVLHRFIQPNPETGEKQPKRKKKWKWNETSHSFGQSGEVGQIFCAQGTDIRPLLPNSRSRIRWSLGVILVVWTDYSYCIQKCRHRKLMLAQFSSWSCCLHGGRHQPAQRSITRPLFPLLAPVRFHCLYSSSLGGWISECLDLVSLMRNQLEWGVHSICQATNWEVRSCTV